MAKKDFDVFYNLDNDSLQEQYTPISILGEGGFGRVFYCQNNDNNEEVAIKIVRTFRIIIWNNFFLIIIVS